MKLIKTTLTFIFLFLAITACSNSSQTDSLKKDKNNANLMTLVTNSQLSTTSSALSALIELQGKYKTYYGNSTSSTGDLYVSVNTSKNGTWLENTSGGNPPFSMAKIIVEYDNISNFLYYQQTVDAAYGNANKYGKIVWTEPASGKFYFCEIAYGKNSLDEAKAVTTQADPTKLDTTGCSNFTWSRAEKY